MEEGRGRGRGRKKDMKDTENIVSHGRIAKPSEYLLSLKANSVDSLVFDESENSWRQVRRTTADTPTKPNNFFFGF